MDFRPIRRKEKALSLAAADQILRGGSYGILSVLGDGGYPYGVALNYVWDGTRLYFHCAREGHKMDAIRGHSKVSFCVVGDEQVVAKKLATSYHCAVLFGNAQEVSDEGEKRRALELLCQKYAPQYPDEGNAEIQKFWKTVCIVSVVPDHISAKGAEVTG